MLGNLSYAVYALHIPIICVIAALVGHATALSVLNNTIAQHPSLLTTPLAFLGGVDVRQKREGQFEQG
jgi:peptidoglycan/LPS O-acetylase OafA/YrhL